MSAVPDDEAALRRRPGIAAAERVGANYREAMQYPSLNVRGMAAGDVGAKARTVVPLSALAEIDIRTVPETSPEYLFARLKEHVQKQATTGRGRAERGGAGALSQAGFAQRRRGVGLQFGGADTARRPGQPLAAAGHAVHLRPAPVQIRMMGGTVPTGAAVQALQSPFVIVPLVNADNNQHSYDENMRLATTATASAR